MLIITCFRFFLNFFKQIFILYIYSFIFSCSFFKNFSYRLCFHLDDFCRPLVIQGECWVLTSIFLFGKTVSYKSEKIKWKVSYALSAALEGKMLSHFMFSRRKLKVSILSLEVPLLINFAFSGEYVSFVLKTLNVGKWSLMSVLIIEDWILFSKTLVKI